MPKQDALVVPAVHAALDDTASVAADRHLAPPSASAPSGVQTGPSQKSDRLPFNFKFPSNTAYTVASALAIVVGLFLLFAWLLRRGWQGATKSLPAEVVSVLGRVPLAAKQYAELIRVGNKLVLVAQTPTGPTTLTEITDSMEVDRLLGLCQQADPHSTTKAFEQVFRQLAREPTPGGFLGQEKSSTAIPQSIDSFGQWRNEAARG
jgi:flagellar biogenesis protein FliO